MKKVLSGNETVAYGVMLSRVGVIAAYPITPQTSIVEYLATMVSSGAVEARFLPVESEHSALASLIGAASAGARTFTATSAQGLALMHELLHWASGARLPIVLVNCNRAMGAPWTIWCDHGDSLSQRDTGVIQIYCEDNQEVIDSLIQAYRIAEEVNLPCLVALDGFYLTHTSEIVDIPDQERVDEFLPPFEPELRLDPDNPRTFSGGTLPDKFMEIKSKLQEAMESVYEVHERVNREYGRIFGRSYSFLETDFADGAETLLLSSGTISGTAREVVQELRSRGESVGAVKMRLFRPFPSKETRELFSGRRRIVVLDRDFSWGQGGILAQEVKAALYNLPPAERPEIYSFTVGIGGKDVTPKTVRDCIGYADSRDKAPDETVWIGLGG